MISSWKLNLKSLMLSSQDEITQLKKVQQTQLWQMQSKLWRWDDFSKAGKGWWVEDSVSSCLLILLKKFSNECSLKMPAQSFKTISRLNSIYICTKTLSYYNHPSKLCKDMQNAKTTCKLKSIIVSRCNIDCWWPIHLNNGQIEFRM